MSSNFPNDPFSRPGAPLPQGNPYPSNPYQPPQQYGPPPSSVKPAVAAAKGKILPPAIVLCVLGSLGLIAAVINVIYALVVKVEVDPNASEFVQSMQKGSVGPVAAVTQSILFFVNAAIIFGSVQMMRVKLKPFAFVAAILAMVNIESCCCVFGLPVGIWAIIILCLPDVSRAFEENA